LEQLRRLRINELAEYTGDRIATVETWRRRRARARALQFDARLDVAMSFYEPKPYSGRVVALYPAQLPGYRDPHANWAGLVTGNFEAYAITGNHKTMLEEAGAADLAARIEACIAEIHPFRKANAVGAGNTDKNTTGVVREEADAVVSLHAKELSEDDVPVGSR
jgi:thioesterase domain-containing protein